MKPRVNTTSGRMLGSMRSASNANLRTNAPTSLERERSFDPDAGSSSPPTDVMVCQQLLANATSDPEKAKLQGLLERLQSPDSPTRESAKREMHVVKSLGLHDDKKEEDKKLERVTSDPDLRGGRPRFNTLQGGLMSARKSSNDASANSSSGSSAFLKSGENTPKPQRRLSFWQRKKQINSNLKLPQEWDDDWGTELDLLSNVDWLDPHKATDESSLLKVETKKFSVALKGSDSKLENGLLLEDWESYRFLYDYIYVGRPHALYLGKGARGPLIVAVETPAPLERKGDRSRYRVLALDKYGYHKGVIPSSQTTRERTKYLKKCMPTIFDGVALKKPEKQQQLSTQLMIFEKKRVVHHAKFGLLYRKEGQLEENEVYGNQHGSPQFVAFVSMLGELIPLKGHKGFRGGLDVREDLTGKTSAYTKLKFDKNAKPFKNAGSAEGGGSGNNNNNNNNNNGGNDGGEGNDAESGGEQKASLEMEIMMHVAPLLPYDTNSEQQLHRKRHIGNDVVVVVFCEGSDPFNPEVLTSNYNHIFILCRPVPDDPSGRKKPTHYSIATASVRGVKPFRPYIAEDTLVPAEEIREWLLTKVLNAERGAMYSGEFSQKLSRTIQTVVGSWVDEF